MERTLNGTTLKEMLWKLTSLPASMMLSEDTYDKIAKNKYKNTFNVYWYDKVAIVAYRCGSV